MIPRVTIRESVGGEDLERIIALRYEILRKPHNLSLADASFPGDSDVNTVHLLAVFDERVVGCLTLKFMPDSSEAQLRGMAIATQYQNQGIGRLLMDAAHDRARVSGKSLWCNARFSAIGFYERNGWVRKVELFEIPVIGMHSVMIWPGFPGSKEVESNGTC
jgi:GNAT superfamily N-acetyltransferase